MSDVSLNLSQTQFQQSKTEARQEPVETGGVIASNQLFSSSSASETCGTIASNSSSSSGGSFTAIG